MEIKTAFSSQFNHDAAIRGFWWAKHVFLFFSLKIGPEESRLRIRNKQVCFLQMWFFFKYKYNENYFYDIVITSQQVRTFCFPPPERQKLW